MTSPNKPACCAPDCCADTKPSNAATGSAADVRDKVREGYGQIARSGQWSGVQAEPAPASCCGASAQPSGTSGGGGGGGCCGGPTTLTPDQVAQAVGYASADLAAIPRGANMGLSCGNPTALASLKAGETVVDLGSGGGFDCFIAGPKVGPAGRVIGVDMTPDMLTKARRNLAAYREQTGLENVEFRLGEIEHLPLPDNSVDVVISNCVLNLSPDKAQVWREIARVLKPGGRVAVSDLALLRPLPESVRADVEALVGCIAGAVLVEETRAQAHAAGLAEIELDSTPQYIDAMTEWQDPLYRKILEALPRGSKAGDFITSLGVRARKPA
ncbi:MAG TPA: arsenite methyltransferase [Phycisphaerales bacterium]|nr:arsenite methyltransferase [Phycisphaerales bacterium]